MALSKLIIFLLLLTACSSSHTEEPTSGVSHSTESKEIFIPLAKREYFSVEDMFSEYHYVQLETNDRCLLPGSDELKRILVDKEGKIYRLLA